MNKPKRCFLLLVVTFLLIASAVLFSLSVSAAEPSDIGGSYYLSENSNVDTIHATTVGAMPCIGEAKIVVFYVDFGENNDVEYPTTKELENMLFSEKAKNDPSLAYTEEDSLRSFYYRSSKGKLDITGSVFEYSVKNDVSSYASLDDVLYEAIDHYRDTINWADYDGNGDGYVDGVYLVNRNLVSISRKSFVHKHTNTVGDMKICKGCFSSPDLGTLIHESCHMLGFGDIYANVNANPSGSHTWTLMDGATGDLPAPIKFCF
jgi:M6 family metalloprotease-like protein